jgi:hypothetical protein
MRDINEKSITNRRQVVSYDIPSLYMVDEVRKKKRIEKQVFK